MHLGELEELSLHLASSVVKEVIADTLLYDIVTKVSALTLMLTWRLKTPFNFSNSLK